MINKWKCGLKKCLLTAFIGSCVHGVDQVRDNDYWWPQRLDLSALRQTNTADPYGQGYNYAEEFKKLDVDALLKDMKALMKSSQDWWPADFGHYGPFFIRMSWHSAGTYRTYDGRGGADGGMQRLAPLNSWPDNANLDKAQRLLWPIKKKYGKSVSWADLMALAGTLAMDDMGFKTLGFAFGREDAYVPEKINWGSEEKWLDSNRHKEGRKLKQPFGATRMGLIYVNPEGPNGVPDPLEAAKDIRATFGRMAMNDEETVALIAGGHTFGKAHGAAKAGAHVGREPEGSSIEEQGFGWKNKYGTGKGSDTITSGLEGAWTVLPAQWTHNYFQNLFNFNWVLTKSPGGATQWTPDNKEAQNMVPDAHDPKKRHAPMMLTTDLSLIKDPAYRVISKRFLDNPKEFEKAYAKAWFKLTHRDMGPRSRYLGPLVPKEEMIWQDPVPAVNHNLIDQSDVAALKASILASGHSVSALVKAAWASASSYRDTDKRGGANGARVRLLPQINWEANDPTELKAVITSLGKIQSEFNRSNKAKQVSMADLIVLAGAAAIEKGAAEGGVKISVPFSPGRMDADQSETDVESFEHLRPKADGFRNYIADYDDVPPVEMLVEKASMLRLSVPEMTVLVGGLRALDANTNGSKLGVLTYRPGVLTNDFFTNLLDMSVEWEKSKDTEGVYDAYSRKSGQLRWQATAVDLIFGSNSELRAVAEVYAADDASQKFVQDFVAAWVKVMGLDRFDLAVN